MTNIWSASPLPAGQIGGVIARIPCLSGPITRRLAPNDSASRRRPDERLLPDERGRFIDRSSICGSAVRQRIPLLFGAYAVSLRKPRTAGAIHGKRGDSAHG